MDFLRFLCIFQIQMIIEGVYVVIIEFDLFSLFSSIVHFFYIVIDCQKVSIKWSVWIVKKIIMKKLRLIRKRQNTVHKK